jgi:hypothetical protein
MAITISIPPDLERQLRLGTPDLDSAAKEAVLIAMFRLGHLTHKQLADALGLDRWQAEDVLNKHNVTEDLPTFDEIKEQLRLSTSLRENP